MAHDPASDVDTVVARYRETARARTGSWNVRRKHVSDAEREARENNAASEVFGIGEAVEAFMQTLFLGSAPEDITFEQFTEAYLLSMRGDIAQCLSEDQQAFFQGVHLRFLATGLANACCINADPSGQPLDFYITFVNEGLYFALGQLITALICEEMQGDLAKYKRDGSPAFKAAIRLYLEPVSANIDTAPLDLNDPEASGEIRAYLASATTIVLLFVCLHEFAHAWLGHHRAAKSARLSLVEPEDSADEVSASDDLKAQEFQADEFAFAALLSRTASPESNWAHAFLIHLFFCYLDAIEIRIGRPLSSLHPPPKERSERLIKRFQGSFPDAVLWQQDMERLEVLVAKWVSG